jgi:hypothetical protein
MTDANARLQLAADKLEIQDLSIRYMRGLDRLDPDIMRTVFHDDGTADYGFYKGSGIAFVDFCMGALKGHLANHHMIGQMFIEVEGDEAFGEIYFHAFHRIVGRGKGGEGEEQDLIIAGRYVDRYTRRDGVWKIAHRTEVNDWARSSKAADGYLKTSDCWIGARKPKDLSYDRAWLRAQTLAK